MPLWTQVRRAICGLLTVRDLGGGRDHSLSPPSARQVIAPLIGAHVPEEKVERNRTAMDRVLQQLEDKFLEAQAFLTGQQVSLADLMALGELMQV